MLISNSFQKTTVEDEFNKFHRAKELLKHAGLDLFEISSGKHKGNKRISKRGRPHLRKLLFFAALGTVRKGGIMHVHYQRHLQKGMKRIKALIAIARKLLCIIFALVRSQSEYLENYQEQISLQQLKKAACITVFSACKRGDYHLVTLRRPYRPSHGAYCSPRLHLSPNEARLEPSWDSRITRVRQDAIKKS